MVVAHDPVGEGNGILVGETGLDLSGDWFESCVVILLTADPAPDVTGLSSGDTGSDLSGGDF